jgi:glycosyltransferase involved in cell wall biosynthesis
MIDVSAIICAHNPRANYLRRVLDALRNQILPQDRWELLLIDNASSVPLAENWDLTWHPRARHVHESELGISAARRRGIKDGHGGVIVFIDDDNVLEPNYLSEALRIGVEWPCLGTWGSGVTLPEFEVPPSESAKQFLGFLALRETSVARWGNTMTTETTPWGAGMCLRRQVAERYSERCEEDKIKITGRKGTSLSSGEDLEIAHVACEMGLGTGVFPELKLLHLIPAVRVSHDYLIKMVEGASTSHYLLKYKWTGEIPVSPFHPRRLLVTLKRLLQSRDNLARRGHLADLRAANNARRVLLSSTDEKW